MVGTCCCASDGKPNTDAGRRVRTDKIFTAPAVRDRQFSFLLGGMKLPSLV